MEREEKRRLWQSAKSRLWEVRHGSLTLTDLLDFLPEERRTEGEWPADGELSGERIYREAKADWLKKGGCAGKHRPRVVFMPYKTALWDSLESIYESAARDPEVEAYVLPVPWYELDAEGKPAILHDETRNFPRHLAVKRWQKFKLKAERPEIIFVQNPYDRFNTVSQLHPDFFISNLRPYVQELVYVPYFVAIKGWVAADRLMSAGLDFSDLVPVESEKVRLQYLAAYRKFAEENGLWEEWQARQDKFRVLGSPKFDRMRCPRPEDRVVPAPWAKVLGQGSGRKKAVLYLTSVQAMFDSECGDMLQEIAEALQIFKEHSGEIALIWRPHPLYREALAHSYYGAEGVARYDALIEHYRKEKWGIYDDTPNLYRSIWLSDAYYGDWSSVTTIYQATGKPILIQDPLNGT